MVKYSCPRSLLNPRYFLRKEHSLEMFCTQERVGTKKKPNMECVVVSQMLSIKNVGCIERNVYISWNGLGSTI